MKRESTIKFISKRLAMLVAFLAVYILLALGGGRAAHAEEGEFKGLLISPASNRIELGMDVEMSVGSYSIENSNYGSPNYDNESKYSVMKDWIRLDKEAFTLAPGESQIVTYTINTPAEPPSGMQYATIFASTTPDSQVEGTGITATSRIGLVLSALMKDGETIQQSSIQDEKIAGYQPTSPLKASFAVKNEGNVGADASYQMIVKSAINGTEVYKSDQDSSSVYPDSTRTFSVSWDQMGIGFYNVELKINLDGNEHTVKQLVCTVPVWIIILVVIAILSLVAYAVINYRMRQEAKGGKTTKKKSTKKSSKK